MPTKTLRPGTVEVDCRKETVRDTPSKIFGPGLPTTGGSQDSGLCEDPIPFAIKYSVVPAVSIQTANGFTDLVVAPLELSGGYSTNLFKLV